MNLLVDNNKVVGYEDGDITHWFIYPKDVSRVPVSPEIAERLNDQTDLLHASDLTIKNGKIIVPKLLKPADDTLYV